MRVGVPGFVRRQSRLAVVTTAAVAVVAASAAVVIATVTTTPDDGAQVFNVKAFGAVGDGVADDTAAIASANSAASASKSLVFFPGGTYKTSATLTATTNWVGTGQGAAVIKLGSALGSGVPAVVVAGHGNGASSTSLENLSVIGLGGRTLGVRNGDADGIRVDVPTRVARVSVEGFDSGIVLNSTAGRITLEQVWSQRNYYGVYDAVGGRDHIVTSSLLTDNVFAALASPATKTLDGLELRRSELGGGPYGIYQEGTASSGRWLNGVRIIDTSFDGVGNGALFTENANPAGGVRSMTIDDPAFSWDSSRRIASRAADHAVVVGTATGTQEITERTSKPLSDGAVGTLKIADNQASWRWIRPTEDAATITVTAGRNDLFHIRSVDLAQRRGSASIAAGATSKVVSLDYLGPVGSIAPLVQATSTGGLTQAFTLIVTDVTSTPAAGTTFTVRVVGAVPPQAMTFSWKLPPGLGHPPDTAAPVSSAALAPAKPNGDAAPGYAGTYNTPVAVTLSATDDASGVAYSEVKVDDAAWAAYTGPVTVSAPGAHTVSYRSTDAAGNTEAAKSLTFTIKPDACPGSDLRLTVFVGAQVTTVPNRDRGDGCTVNDLIDEKGPWASKGAFMNHVDTVTSALVAAGVINDSQKSQIMRAATLSNIGVK